jgi:HK97 family phage prohead protease
MSYELRSIVGPESIDATDEGIIFGLAIPYNKVTTIGDMAHGGFREQIAPGSTTKSIKEGDIVALFNHNSGQPLGRTSAGNLKLTNATRGVEPELKPSDTSYSKDLAQLVKDKVIRGWSFGFEVIKDEWTDDEGRESNEYTGTNRVIREMKLIEVSPVTFPAYGDGMTNISSRDAVLAARESRGRKYESRDADKAMEFMGDAASLLVSAINELTPEQVDMLPDSVREAYERAKGSPKPYGNVAYADPQNGKYPIDTAAHAKAAWAYINMPKNAAKYPLNGVSLSSVKSRIRGACAKFGISLSDENESQFAYEWRELAKTYNPDDVPDGHEGNANCVECGTALTCRTCRRAAKDQAKAGKLSSKTSSPEVTPESDTPEGEDDVARYDGQAEDGGQTDNQKNPMPNKFTGHGKKNKAKIKDKAKEQNSDDPDGETRRDPAKSTGKLSTSTSKRIPQIDALLGQALKLIGNTDMDALPDDVQNAIGLISSAATHSDHIMDHEGLKKGDAISPKDKAGRAVRASYSDFMAQFVPTGSVNEDNDDGGFSVCETCGGINPMAGSYCCCCGDPLGNPSSDDGRDSKNPSAETRNAKPDKTTSQTPLTNDALRLAYMQAVSREVELGI